MDTLSYKTISGNKETANKQWLLIDAEGKNLGRICSEIAFVLRGKWDEKQYIRYTGYPGGQRFATPKEMMAKHPTAMIEMGVRGMLPKNRLGRAIYRNLFVYAGAEHGQTAQQPKVHTITR
jgi:large subunit ribosomal protein L13